MSIYLDYNASAPIDERVLDKMISVYRNTIGNADSRTHEFQRTLSDCLHNGIQR